MQVAFVNVGLEKAGFLYVGDIDIIDLLDYEADEDESESLNSGGNPPDMDRSPREIDRGIPIQDLLHEGQEIMVQVAKNPLGTKGPESPRS